MAGRRRRGTLESLLDGLPAAGDGAETVSVADIREHLGRRAFGPVLLLAALPPMTPLATIPALPLTMGAIILLTAGQLLFGRDEIWLPRFILRRSVGRGRIEQVVRRIRPVARVVDGLVRPRLAFLVRPPWLQAIAVVCCLLGLTMPPLELVPFTSGLPALPVAIFGLALIAEDGVLVIVAAVVLGLVLGVPLAILARLL